MNATNFFKKSVKSMLILAAIGIFYAGTAEAGFFRQTPSQRRHQLVPATRASSRQARLARTGSFRLPGAIEPTSPTVSPRTRARFAKAIHAIRLAHRAQGGQEGLSAPISSPQPQWISLPRRKFVTNQEFLMYVPPSPEIAELPAGLRYAPERTAGRLDPQQQIPMLSSERRRWRDLGPQPPPEALPAPQFSPSQLQRLRAHLEARTRSLRPGGFRWSTD